MAISRRQGLGGRIAWEALEPRLMLSGTVYWVDSLDDVVAADGVVTLREAIQAANTDWSVYDAPAGTWGETDIIRFAPALTEAGPASIVLDGTELKISRPLAIQGPGAELLSIDADGASRVFLIDCEIPVAISGLTVTGGAADEGGGIKVRNSATLTMSDAIVSGNVATKVGGGVWVESHGAAVLSDVTLSENSTVGYGSGSGGGLFVTGTADLVDVTIVGNRSERGRGAGVFCEGELTIAYSEILGNTGERGDGAGLFNAGTTAMINCVVVGNVAEYVESSAGGVCNDDGATLVMVNSTIAANSDAGVANDASLMMANSIVALNEDSDYVGNEYDGLRNLIDADPQFLRNPSPGVDGQWGTMDDDFGDLRVHAHSPAINMGDNIAAVDALGQQLIDDSAGSPRFVDGVVDVGAFEHQGPMQEWGEGRSTVVATLVDVIDASDGAISLREAIWYAWSPDLPDTITFDPALTRGAIDLGGRELLIDLPVTIDASDVDWIRIDAGQQSRAFRMQDAGDVELVNLRITGGRAPGDHGGVGGGVFVENTNIAVVGCGISLCSATGWGGGLYILDGSLFMANSIAISNHADYEGGGIYSSGGGSVELRNVTVAGNDAFSGGGLYVPHSTLTVLRNSIIAMNEGLNLYAYIDPQNCIIDDDPGFENANDGSFYGSVALAPNSPAIDAGDAADAVGPAGEPFGADYYGRSRFVGRSVDIGASEFQDLRGDVDRDGDVDLDDFVRFKIAFQDQGWWYGDIDGDHDVDLDDFVLLKLDFGLRLPTFAAPTIATSLSRVPARPLGA